LHGRPAGSADRASRAAAGTHRGARASGRG